MTDQNYAREMEDLLREIPPEAAGVDPRTVTPWHSAMEKILWGIGLLSFRLEVWYLQYLLPLLGAALLYLGARRLRTANRGFRRVWQLSQVILVWQVGFLAVLATRWEGVFMEGGVSWVVSALGCALNFSLFWQLRRGIREAFAGLAGEAPRDWLLLGLAAWLGVLVLAVWSTAEPIPAGGAAALWLRFLVAALFYVLLLWLLHRQGRALERRGYAIVPAPVRCRDGGVIALTFLAAALLVGPAMVWGARTPQPEAAMAEAASADLETVRARLTELGMPEELAADLSERDLRLCESAVEVHESTDHLLNGEPAAPQALGGGTVELRSWTVVLADQSLRFFQTFQWLKLPAMSVQEAVYADPDGGRAFTDPTARLTWSRAGERLAADLPVELAGGQMAEELTEEQMWWYEEELQRLGHLQYQPYALFSLPRGGEEVRGYLAYSRTAKAADYSGGSIFGGWYYVRQSFPQYPYVDIGSAIRGKSGEILSFGGDPFPYVGVSYGTYVWAWEGEA